MAEKFAQFEAQRIARKTELQELKLRTVEAEAKANDDASSSDGEGEHIKYKTIRPTMPAFNECKDDIDAYLQIYERVAEVNKWPATDWALHPSTLLTGKALKLYARLPAEDARTYEKLKAALLRRYELTVDGFRKRFYEARRETEETATEYLSCSSRYLSRIELSKINPTFAELSDLIVKEQCLDMQGSVEFVFKGEGIKGRR